ncbi:MAG TPA: hypothetical protein VNQ73_11985 [Ilumatobacter sp.]|nr:hypothetical protein [Ilumatobacter sp.]
MSRLLLEGWTPRAVDGVTTAFDNTGPENDGVGTGSAVWVSGDWGYVVIGHRFNNAEAFDAALQALQLADEQTFAAATAGVPEAFLPTVEEDNAKLVGT